MTCPHCNQSFEGSSGLCPRCRAKGVVKTSTILISAGDMSNVYHSVEEIPDALKTQLIRSTQGINSTTLVIADREGRKEIARAIRNLPGAGSPPATAKPVSRSRFRPTMAQAVGFLLLGTAVAVIWFTFRLTS